MTGFRPAFAVAVTVRRDTQWAVAEQLGKPTWSKWHGFHVDFRTVKFEPGADPIRVRITRTQDMGRLRSLDDARRVLSRIHAQIVEGHKLEDVLARYVERKLPANLVPARWRAFCESKRAKVKAGKLDPRRLRELECYEQRGYLAPFGDLAVQEVRELELLSWVECMRSRASVEARATGCANGGPYSATTPGQPAPVDSRRPLSEKTLRNVLADIGQFFRWLELHGVIQKAPRIPTAEFEVEEYAPTIPDAATVAKILAEIPLELRGIFLARSYMGLRPSEARRLDVADLRDEGRAVQVLARKSKKRRTRLLALPAPVLEWIATHRAQAFPAEPLFPNPRARNPQRRWTEKVEWEAFKLACRNAGVPEFKPNEAGRHFFGTEHVNAGVDVFAVSKWLGHSEIKTTSRYAKLRPQTLARVVRLKE